MKSLLLDLFSPFQIKYGSFNLSGENWPTCLVHRCLKAQCKILNLKKITLKKSYSVDPRKRYLTTTMSWMQHNASSVISCANDWGSWTSMPRRSLRLTKPWHLALEPTSCLIWSFLFSSNNRVFSLLNWLRIRLRTFNKFAE